MRMLGLLSVLLLTVSCAGNGGPLWSFVDNGGGVGLNRSALTDTFGLHLTSFQGGLALIHEEGGQVRVTLGRGFPIRWTAIDGGGAIGINKANTATGPRIVSFNSKLYAAWDESGGVAQIRVAVYNGNPAAPVWSLVDGNGVNGLNKNPARDARAPKFATFNGKLYLTWYEDTATVSQIRIAVFNGNDFAPSWTFVDGGGVNGINRDPIYNAQDPYLLTDGSRLYAAWDEDNIDSQEQIRVAAYNGNDSSPSWAFVDGGGVSGLNRDALRFASSAHLGRVGSHLYATWTESNGTSIQIRAAAFNGNLSSPSWSFVDGGGTTGLNSAGGGNASNPQLAEFRSQLHATWTENAGFAGQVRVARYNGTDGNPSWTFIEEKDRLGISVDPINSSVQTPGMTVADSNGLYVGWGEVNLSGFSVVRLAVTRR